MNKVAKKLNLVKAESRGLKGRRIETKVFQVIFPNGVEQIAQATLIQIVMGHHTRIWYQHSIVDGWESDRDR